MFERLRERLSSDNDEHTQYYMAMVQNKDNIDKLLALHTEHDFPWKFEDEERHFRAHLHFLVVCSTLKKNKEGGSVDEVSIYLPKMSILFDGYS